MQTTSAKTESTFPGACSSDISSPILALPREIRELIYGYLLVPGTVSIASKILHLLQARQPPTVCRKTWTMATFHGPITAVSSGTVDPRSLSSLMTYGLPQRCDDDSGDDDQSCPRFDLQIMSVCRQLYLETREIFYTKNTFRFAGDYRIPTALFFLQDRLAESLFYIRSLELALTEDESSYDGFPDQYISLGHSYRESLVLRFAYRYFDQFCSLLSSPSMRLRNLALSVETFNRYRDRRGSERPWTMRGWLQFEDAQSVKAPSWLDPLLAVQDLDTLSLCWDFKRPLLHRTADVARLMRDSMLGQNSNKMEKNDDDVLDLKLFMVNYPYEEPLLKDGVSFSGQYSFKTGELDWRNCFLHLEDTRLIEVGKDIYNGKAVLKEKAKLLEEKGSFMRCFIEMRR